VLQHGDNCRPSAAYRLDVLPLLVGASTARTQRTAWQGASPVLVADVAGASPVLVQMWQGRAQSRCRCGGLTCLELLVCRALSEVLCKSG
jgi:hypothetical protein